jgi:TatD DNase family protein
MLVDSHCHLDFDDFKGEQEDVVARARAAGIKGMLTICTRLADAANIRAIAAAHDGIWCSVGIHPHEAEDGAGVTAEELITLAEPAEIVGIGETGLDFYYEHSPRDIQEEVFRAHIQAARQTGLPIIVHTRDADADTVRILAQEQARGPFSGVIHCFSAGAEVARCALDHGMYISFSGIVTFKNADAVRMVARDVPMERLLVETDAPYLAPVPVRGKRNEPAFTAHTAAYVAEIKGLGLDEFARVTTDNFFTLFDKANRDDLP